MATIEVQSAATMLPEKRIEEHVHEPKEAPKDDVEELPSIDHEVKKLEEATPDDEEVVQEFKAKVEIEGNGKVAAKETKQLEAVMPEESDKEAADLVVSMDEPEATPDDEEVVQEFEAKVEIESNEKVTAKETKQLEAAMPEESDKEATDRLVVSMDDAAIEANIADEAQEIPTEELIHEETSKEGYSDEKAAKEAANEEEVPCEESEE